MTRIFTYLIETSAEITDQAIFSDTSHIIETALVHTRYQSEESTKYSPALV